MESIRSILDFWFGEHDSEVASAAAQAKLWWSKDSALDGAIRRRFEATLALAAGGGLDAWADTAPGCLALILLTDQFPRNMYRGTPTAFSFDTAAREWCRRGMEKGLDRQLSALRRVFFYLPLEHSEALADQERSVMLFDELLRRAPHDSHALFADYHRYALRHREIIARFGRFPHRNGIMARESTGAEEEFLSQPGSSF